MYSITASNGESCLVSKPVYDSIQELIKEGHKQKKKFEKAQEELQRVKDAWDEWACTQANKLGGKFEDGTPAHKACAFLEKYIEENS